MHPAILALSGLCMVHGKNRAKGTKSKSVLSNSFGGPLASALMLTRGTLPGQWSRCDECLEGEQHQHAVKTPQFLLNPTPKNKNWPQTKNRPKNKNHLGLSTERAKNKNHHGHKQDKSGEH